VNHASFVVVIDMDRDMVDMACPDMDAPLDDHMEVDSLDMVDIPLLDMMGILVVLDVVHRMLSGLTLLILVVMVDLDYFRLQ
jgi:hypothetical protein